MPPASSGGGHRPGLSRDASIAADSTAAREILKDNIIVKTRKNINIFS